MGPMESDSDSQPTFADDAMNNSAIQCARIAISPPVCCRTTQSIYRLNGAEKYKNPRAGPSAP